MVSDLGFVLRIWRTTEMFSARKEVTCNQDSPGIVLRRMKTRRKLMVQSGVVWALTGCKWHIWVAERRKKIFCFGRLQNVVQRVWKKSNLRNLRPVRVKLYIARAGWTGKDAHLTMRPVLLGVFRWFCAKALRKKVVAGNIVLGNSAKFQVQGGWYAVCADLRGYCEESMETEPSF